jgi:hypothetical protein
MSLLLQTSCLCYWKRPVSATENVLSLLLQTSCLCYCKRPVSAAACNAELSLPCPILFHRISVFDSLLLLFIPDFPVLFCFSCPIVFLVHASIFVHLCPASTVQKRNSWTYNFVEVSGHNLDSSQTWGFRIQCLPYIAKQFQTTFAQRGGGVIPLVEVTVYIKEVNLKDFCPDYVQEFRLSLLRCLFSPSCLWLFWT